MCYKVEMKNQKEINRIDIQQNCKALDNKNLEFLVVFLCEKVLIANIRYFTFKRENFSGNNGKWRNTHIHSF